MLQSFNDMTCCADWDNICPHYDKINTTEVFKYIARLKRFEFSKESPQYKYEGEIGNAFGPTKSRYLCCFFLVFGICMIEHVCIIIVPKAEFDILFDVSFISCPTNV